MVQSEIDRGVSGSQIRIPAIFFMVADVIALLIYGAVEGVGLSLIHI